MDKLVCLSSQTISRVVGAVEEVMREAVGLFGDDPEWKGRSGGYFCLADGLTGTPRLIALIGSIPSGKYIRYFHLVREKIERLNRDREHITSWESRNPSTEQFGGAIRREQHIFSFSGFPEWGDEMIMLGTIFMMANPIEGEMESLRAIAEAHGYGGKWQLLLQPLFSSRRALAALDQLQP